jgi:uncharacterized protein YhdP
VERLHWGDDALGRMTLEAAARDDGLAFRALELDGRPLMRIAGSGSWTQDGNGQKTAVSLEAVGDNLGEFLRHLGYSSTLDKAPAEARLELSWPGDPGSPPVSDLTGTVEAELGEGSLLDVDPGVGRMLGVLNLNALQRRLSLDFSDLFQRGYAFERMHGKIDIGGGEARIAEMVIEGPAAAIRIEGRTDLVAQEFAQIVTVTPSLGTSVALAGAVAGGPLVGAAVLIADKVSGGAVDRIGSYQYEVTGPWRDPHIVRRSRLESEPEAQAFLPAEDSARNQAGTGETRPPPARPDHGGGEAQETQPAPNLFLDVQ